MSTKTGRRALAAGAAAVALLGLAADQAAASVTASVQNGTLQVNGNSAADTIVLRVDGADPTMLQVDVGGDGTAEFHLTLAGLEVGHGL